MLSYFLRRMLLIIPTFLGITLLVFTITRFVPGGPVERMLLQLWHAGVLQKQKAILLGDFSGYKLGDYDNGYDFAAMAGWISDRCSVPVLQGLPFGHIRDKVTLPVGAACHLSSDAHGFRLQLSGYPNLR